MKKIRMTFTVMAILVAACGIGVHAMMPTTTTYWVPSWANRFAITGAFCDFQVLKPCDEGTGLRCTVAYSYIGQGVFNVIVSKEDVSTGICSAYFKIQ